MGMLGRLSATLILILAGCASGDGAEVLSTVALQTTTTTTGAATLPAPTQPTSTTTVEPEPAAASDWISFVAPCRDCTDVLEGADVFAIRSDGAELTLLTHDVGPIRESPVWSPDGSYLALPEAEAGTVGLYAVTDFTFRNRIEIAGPCWLPVWSADSETFATACDSGDDTSHLVLGSAESMVPFPDYPVGFEVTWLPEDRVLFTSSRAGGWDFYSVGLDDQVPVRVTDSSWPQGPSFAVSPDGNRVAFTVKELNKIMMMGADGSGLTSIPIEASPLRHSLSWSPDGSRVGINTETISAETDTWTWAVSVMNPDGTEMIDLATASEACDPSPLEWSPGGDRVAFSARESTDSPDSAMYTVDPTGGELTNLAAALGLDVEITSFSWAPDGSYLAMAIRPSVSATMAAIETHGWEGWSDAFGAESFGIYVAQADGSEFTQISPQGELLAFMPGEADQ